MESSKIVTIRGCKAMPAVRSVLGHVSVETAEKKRKCHRKAKHSVPKGETCLVVRGGPYNSSKNYCKECAPEILNKAEADLLALRKGLK